MRQSHNFAKEETSWQEKLKHTYKIHCFASEPASLDYIALFVSVLKKY